MDIKKGDYVVYRGSGVCQVVDIESQTMDGIHSILYYKLKPLHDINSTYYIPVEKAYEKIRHLLSKDDIINLIDSIPYSEPLDTALSDNRRERKELYSQIIKSDDPKALLSLILSLYFKKISSETQGKRFSSMDETVMKNIEQPLLQEFGFVLGMEEDELRKFIDTRVTKIHRTNN